MDPEQEMRVSTPCETVREEDEEAADTPQEVI